MKPVSEIVITDDERSVNPEEPFLCSLVYPLDAGVRRSVDEWITAVSEQLKQAVTRFKREGLAAARATMTHLQSRRAAHTPRLAEAEAAYSRAVPGSLACALVLSPFVASCIGMEFVISWVALSQLFGVDPQSTLGIMLGIGPTAALAVLKVIVARLFEDSYQDLRHGLIQSRWSRVVVRTCMGVFLVVVAVLNVYTIVEQAKVREEVSSLAGRLLTNDDVTEFEPVESEAAVVATSLTVSINGAILFIIVWNEFGCWGRRRSARKAVEAERGTMRTLDEEVARAEADVAARAQEDVAAVAALAAVRRGTELRIVLEREERRQSQGRTALESVTHGLRALRVWA